MAKSAMEIYKEKMAARNKATKTYNGGDTGPYYEDVKEVVEPVKKVKKVKSVQESKVKLESNDVKLANQGAKTTAVIEKKAKVSTSKLSTTSLVEKLRGKLNTLQGNAGTTRKYNFHKFEEGKNAFRWIEPSEGPILLAYKQHRNNNQYNYRTAVDLKFVISDDEICQAMLERERLTTKDVKLIRRYGDPYDVLWKALSALGISDAFRNAGIGQKRCMIIAYKDDMIGVMDLSLTMAGNLVALYEEDNTVTSIEDGVWLGVTKTVKKAIGRKKQASDTTYTSPMPLLKTKDPVVIEEGTVIPNLYDILAGRVMHYADKVQFLFSNHEKLATAAGLSVEDFGITEGDFNTSFQYGANASSKNVEKEEAPKVVKKKESFPKALQLPKEQEEE